MAWAEIVGFFPALYALGCGISQSLMSLMACALLALAAWRWRSLPRLPLLAGLAFVFYAEANLLLRDSSLWLSREARNAPLLLVPLSAAVLRLDERQRSWTLRAAVGGVLAAAVLALKHTIEGYPIMGFFGSPIHFAYALLPAFVFFSEAVLLRGVFDRLSVRVAMLGAVVTAVLLLLSGIRGTWLAMGAYIVLRALPLLWRRAGLRGAFVLLAVASAAGFAAYQTQPYVREKIRRTLSGSDASWQSRKQIWQYNWQLFTENPLTGVGMGQNVYHPADSGSAGPGLVPGFDYYAHSAYLQLLAEGGLLGLALFAFYIYSLWRQWRGTHVLLLVSAIGAMTENILNNSKAAHPLLCYLLLSALFFSDPRLRQEADLEAAN